MLTFSTGDMVYDARYAFLRGYETFALVFVLTLQISGLRTDQVKTRRSGRVGSGRVGSGRVGSGQGDPTGPAMFRNRPAPTRPVKSPGFVFVNR